MVASRDEKLTEALRTVIDPEIGLNIVELGLVRGFDFSGEKPKVTMILTTPFCPYGPAIIEQVRFTAKNAMEEEVEVEIGTELWDPSMMEEGAGGDWGLF